MGLWSDLFSGKLFQNAISAVQQYGSAKEALNAGLKNYQDQKSQPNGVHSIWDDLTGRTNTDVVNSATAALQEDAQQFNAEEAQKQRDFQAQQADIERQRADTAVQRQMADYSAAGLNPILVAGGSGAGSPGIASGSAASSGANSAINATKSGAEMLTSLGTTAAGVGILLKAIKAMMK